MEQLQSIKIPVELRASANAKPSLVHSLSQWLTQNMPVDVKLGSNVELSPDEYIAGRKQYRADLSLTRLSKQAPPAPSRMLCVVAEDIFLPGLKYVFGLADPVIRTALVSLNRLGSQYFGTGVVSGSVLLDRLTKEACHELIHTFGLGHCADISCVMHFSNSQADTDLKSTSPCKRCAAELAAKINGL